MSLVKAFSHFWTVSCASFSTLRSNSGSMHSANSSSFAVRNFASLPSAWPNDVILEKEWSDARFKLFCQHWRHCKTGIICIAQALADAVYLSVCRLTPIGPRLDLLGYDLFECFKVTFFKIAQRGPILVDMVRVEGFEDLPKDWRYRAAIRGYDDVAGPAPKSREDLENVAARTHPFRICYVAKYCDTAWPHTGADGQIVHLTSISVSRSSKCRTILVGDVTVHFERRASRICYFCAGIAGQLDATVVGDAL